MFNSDDDFYSNMDISRKFMVGENSVQLFRMMLKNDHE